MVTDRSADPLAEARQERTNRIRIGATGLASIVVIVLLAATFSGTASNEPELTPEAMAEQIDPGTELSSEEELPQEPLAELGVAPGTGPVEETDAEPDPEIIIEDDADDSCFSRLALGAGYRFLTDSHHLGAYFSASRVFAPVSESFNPAASG